MGTRVGLYGGSFDPIHNGHLIVARAVAEKLGLERMIFLPSATPPHKSAAALLDGRHRAEMVRLAIEGESIFEQSDHDLTRAGPSYTIDTIAHFRHRLGVSSELSWIIGADSLFELPTWHRAADLVRACHIVTARRPGWLDIDWRPLGEALGPDVIELLRAGMVETPAIDISSTQIRKRIESGRSIRYLVPDAVRNAIETHAWYQRDPDC